VRRGIAGSISDPDPPCEGLPITASIVVDSSIAALLAALRHPKLLKTDLSFLASARADHEPTSFAVQGERLIAYLHHRVHALAQRFAKSEQELVLRDLRLDRFAQRLFRAEEAIRRHKPSDPLMRSKVVVVRKEVREPRACVREILRLHACPEFAADGFP
jgi:hypothetical protein